MTNHEKEWPERRDDERFDTLHDLYQVTKERAERCEEIEVDRRRLKIIPSTASLNSPPGPIQVKAGDLVLTPTHWAFSQLASLARWRATDLRKVCPQLVKLNLEYGLKHRAANGKVKLLYESEPPGLRLRALTGTGFGRIWDHQVIEEVMAFARRGNWRVPATLRESSTLASALYLSDHDFFVFLLDEEHPVEIAKPGGGSEKLFLGLSITNSEVGKSSLMITPFLYRWRCENRMLVEIRGVFSKLAIRHIHTAPETYLDKVREWLAEFEKNYRNGWSAAIKKRLEQAMGKAVGEDDQSVKRWLVRRGFAANWVDDIIAEAWEQEGNARTVWELVQGGTALARQTTYADVRVALEIQLSRLLVSATGKGREVL